MKKKYIRIFIFALFSFFMSSVSVFAREMTIDELGEEASKIQSNAGYVYILGEYAFTSNYNIFQEDIIIASTSLKLENPTDLSQAVIYQIERVRDDNFNPIGWKVGPNLLGQKGMPSKVDVKWIDMHRVLEKSQATINLDINKTEFSAYTDILQKKLNFKFNENYGDEKLTYLDGKVSGFLLQNKKISLNDDDRKKFNDPKYFFAYVLEVPNANENTIITTSGMGRNGEIKWDNFDVKNGEKSGIVVLVPVDPIEWSKDSSYTITIDLDGDKTEQDEYSKTDYKLDLSGLRFQQDSNFILTDSENDISDADKKTLSEWGYTLTGDNKHYQLETADNKENTYNLIGKVEKQFLKENTFNQNAEEGYFFVFNLKKPDNLDKVPEGVKVTVIGENTITYGKESFNNQDVFTEIFKLKDNCASNNCQIIIKVDWDGEGKEYLESQDIIIDYSSLSFVKGSKFTVTGVDSSGETVLDNAYGWKKPDNFNVEFNTDGEIVKVTGLLPILKEFKENKEPFAGEDATGYYLPFTIKTSSNKHDNENKTTVKFINDGENSKIITADNFDDTTTLYVLKHLDKNMADKTFKIIVDMDGDGKEYSPYELIIDYTGLEFQTESLGGVYSSFLDTTSLDENSEEQKELNGYQFNPETVKGVTIKTEQPSGDGSDSSKTVITGNIKEQTLNNGFDNNTGYFVPIKISVPKEEEWFEKYQNKWTITLNTEKGLTKIYTPTAKEYEQGWVLVLFRLNEEKNEIKYKIDFDGEGPAFLPTEYTINYDGLKFQTENKVIFEYFDEKTGKISTKDEVVYQGEAIPNTIAPQIDDKNYLYHKFDYWYEAGKDSNKEFEFGTDSTDKNEDITLKAHWTIDIDTFLTDVINDLKDPESSISEDFSDKFDIEKLGNTITFKVKDSTTLLSEMNSTSIPGTIAYILQRGEIKDITLAFGGQKVVFTKDGENNQVQTVSLDEAGIALKEKVQKGAKALFQKVLSDDEETMTLNKMAVDNRTFTLTIGKTDDSVKLTDDSKTEYTFKFETDATGVSSEEQLTAALTNPSIKHIDITGNFEVKKTVEVTRDVVINGGSGNYTITAGSGVDTIFTVKSDNVTIENIELKDAQTKAIVVEKGSLTTTGVKITHKDTIPELFEAGIEVKSGASLTASNMTFDKEHYNKPLVKAEKDKATVNLKDKESSVASKITKEKINKVSADSDTKEPDTDYQYYNYYNDKNNSKIYTTLFNNHEAAHRLQYTKYNFYNEQITPPDMAMFKTFNYEGETYTLIGFSEKNEDSVIRDEQKTPESVIKQENLKATDDKLYWASFKVTTISGISKVSTTEEFKKQLEDPNIHSIYINSGVTIDLSSEEIKINRDLSIIGTSPSTTRPTLKTKKITTTNEAKDVLIYRLNLEITAEQNQNSLIDVSGEKFALWQSGLENNGEQVDYSIKYNNEKSVVDIRWMGIDSKGFNPNNINKAYIYVAGKLAEGTDIFLNTFKKINETASNVIINGFDASAIITEGDSETDIRYSSNSYPSSTGGNKYAVRISKEASGQNAAITFTSFSEAVIGVDWDETNKDFSNIKIYDADLSKVKAEYIKNDGSTSQTIQDGKGITFVTNSVMVPSNVSEVATISGLTKNGNTYSGLVSQSVDGKFYLPLTLTSSKFQDRVSTVIVTDPNGNSKEYLYSSNSDNGVATISSANTMQLNLEAIKSSKINSETGKVYNIAIDYNGDKTTDNNYIIDYSDVETLEERINIAAQNTLNAKSFTVIKNNHINGYVENFTYKFNSETGLTHLKSDKDNVEEYTFSLKYVGNEDSKVSVVTRKQTEHETGKVYINDWEYLHPQKVGRAIHEVTMLTDVMKDTKTSINAIDKVKLTDENTHTYEVTLNRDKYNNWVKENYLSNPSYSSAEWALNEIVTVYVVLDDSEQYIKSIETSQKSSNNKFDVTFENVNDTNIEVPTKFLAPEGQTLQDEDIKNFYENGKKWWDKYIYENAYKQ